MTVGDTTGLTMYGQPRRIFFGTVIRRQWMPKPVTVVGTVVADSKGTHHDFVCTSGYIEEDEDGPSFCRRFLARKAAAE